MRRAGLLLLLRSVEAPAQFSFTIEAPPPHKNMTVACGSGEEMHQWMKDIRQAVQAVEDQAEKLSKCARRPR